MYSAVWEYIIPSSQEKEDLWNNCIFVFDTNVLLNLYRYTANTRNTLLNALDDLKERVWLPYQVAYEFAKNRFNVIYETQEKYKALEKMAEDFIEKYVTELRLKPSDEAIVKLQTMINTWLVEQKESNILVSQASNDKILDKILSIINGKVGKVFSQEELAAIYDEGKERYQNQVQPGFCDSKKENGASDNNVYGDLVVWKEILSYSANSKKNVIYITHDQKRDWWLIAKGRTVGPRIELRKEFFDITGQKFYMYSMESFLEQYSKHKGQETDQNVIDEVSHFDGSKKWEVLSSNLEPYTPQTIGFNNSIAILQRRIARRYNAIAAIQAKYQYQPIPPHVLVQIENAQRKIRQFEHELSRKQKELDESRHQIGGREIIY